MADAPRTTATDDDLATIRRIIAAGRTAIVTTRSSKGALHSRPLALLDDEFEGSLWFFTLDPSDKTDDVRRHDQVNVSIQDDKGFLSLAGAATIDRSQARIDRYWNAFADAYFEGGPEDPAVALLRVDVETAEYWDTDKPLVKKAFELAKGLVTREEPDLGDNKAVEL
jgi:general stress protein 26